MGEIARKNTTPSFPHVREGELIPKEGTKLKPVHPGTWHKFLGKVTDGMSVPTSLKIAGLTRGQLEGVLRGDEKRREEYRKAKLAAHWSSWSLEDIERIMVEIAMGGTVRAAVTAALAEWEGDDKAAIATRMKNFYTLLLRDELVREMYDEARQIQAEKMALDDLLEIADDMSGDETTDGKPNAAAVNRARLRVDARKWAASKLHYKRFGDKIDQNINAHLVVDHAARLEEARKRKEKLNADRKKRGELE